MRINDCVKRNINRKAAHIETQAGEAFREGRKGQSLPVSFSFLFIIICFFLSYYFKAMQVGLPVLQIISENHFLIKNS